MSKLRVASISLLVVVGLFFLSYNYIAGAIYENWLNKHQEEVLSGITKEAIEAREKELAKEESSFDYGAIQSINNGMIPPKLDPGRMNNAIGVISIPSVNLEEPILYGTTNENLMFGATTMKPDQKMGRGNYTLAGHSHPTRNILFQPIRDVKDGDLIYVTDKNKVYTYKVTNKKVVMPDKIEVLDDVPGKELVTLVSCFSDDGSDRVIVTGELSNIADYQE